MNVETLKDLLWLVPVAVGFLWLMRRGACGGHAGHARSPHDAQGAGPGNPIDPICGMEVEPGRAAGTRTVGGHEYSFCSPRCLKTFDEDPSAYTRGANERGSRHARHGCC